MAVEGPALVNPPIRKSRFSTTVMLAQQRGVGSFFPLLDLDSDQLK